jgi:surfactin synthase thioesterase subunit
MAVAQAALAVAGDRPIAVHGHSAGACLATLVAAALHRAGRPPIWLGVAAMTAPGVPTPPLAHLPSAPLWAELERRYGVPPGGRTPPELHELVEPALRADLELVETWQPPAQAVCPVVAIAATGDAVATPAAMQGWVGWAGGRARFDVIAGDHWAALAPAVLARLISPVGPSAAPP